jgi:type IV pilus biogenesis protein CpaD/CtpE
MSMKKIHSLCLLTTAAMLSGCGIVVDSPTYAHHNHQVGVIRDAKTGKSVAVVKPCPEWNHHPWDGLENHLPEEYGCADAYNLAHSVEQPSDLVRGRALGDAEASTGVLGIERYREGKTKELINPKEIGATGTQ